MAKRIKRFGASVFTMACIWAVVLGLFFLGAWLARTLILDNVWVGTAGGALLLLILVGLMDAWRA